MKTPRTSALVAGVGALLIASTLLLGPVLADTGPAPPPAAPTETPVSTPTPADPSDSPETGNATPTPTTLVGVQGVGSYHAGGFVAAIRDGEVQWRAPDSETYFDVSRLDNGSVLAGFMQGGYEACGPYESPCPRTGFRIIDPDAPGGPTLEYEWSFPVRTRANSEVHDVERLPSGEFLLTDMEHERVMTVRNGEITWQWNASTRYERPDDPTRTDWLHMNDVDRIGEGRYLVSVRNANQLLVLERGAGVVEVINEDGDAETLDHQHNPQWLRDGAVLVADSENHRVVELHRTADGDWRPVWVLTGAGDRRFNWPRDADRLPNGNTLITDTRNARVLEVTRSGDVVRSHQFSFDTLPYESDRNGVEPTGNLPLYGDGAPASPTPTDTAPTTESDPSPGTATPTPVPVTPATVGGSGTPVLTPAYRLVSAAAPLPLWFGELHLLSSTLGVVLLGVGAILRRRGI